MYDCKYMYDTTLEELKELQKEVKLETKELNVHYIKNGIVLPCALEGSRWDANARQCKGGGMR